MIIPVTLFTFHYTKSAPGETRSPPSFSSFLALEDSLTSARLAPDSCICLLGLAETYVARKETANAREALNKILAMPGLPDGVLEGERSRQRARDILAGLK
ncbi:MAG: hypothetical protein AB1700_14390 [Bacillota bacterium]